MEQSKVPAWSISQQSRLLKPCFSAHLESILKNVSLPKADIKVCADAILQVSQSCTRNCPAGFIFTVTFKLLCVKLCYHFMCSPDFFTAFATYKEGVPFPTRIALHSVISKTFIDKRKQFWLLLFILLSFYLTSCQQTLLLPSFKMIQGIVVYAKINTKVRHSIFHLG